MSDRQRHGFVLLLVLGLIAASLFVIFTQTTELGLDLKGGTQLVYQGEPSGQTPNVTQAALDRAVDIMRERVDQLGVSEPEIQTSGGNQITVGLPDVQDTQRAESEVGTTAQLYFYDWEANALTPNGKTVESQLQTQDTQATTISQGTSFAAPGTPNAGQHEPVRRGQAGLPAAQRRQLQQRAPRAAVLHVRGTRKRRLQGAGPA